MNVLDLFSGIGGFSLGLERAGMRTVAFCEIDPYCRKVLAKHWPGVPIFEDVTKLRGADVGAVDVICGGFPCQDISQAGKRVGIEGDRSGLWKEYARIVGELRPRFVIVENVAALLNQGLDVVLGDLAALGYDAEWHCIPAAAVGAPHIRDRIWIVAYPQHSDADSERSYRTSEHVNGNPEFRNEQIGEPRSLGEAMADPNGWGQSGEREPQHRDEQSTSRRQLNGRGSRGWRPGQNVADADRNDKYGRSGSLQMGWGRFAREATADGDAGRTQWSPEPNVGRVAHGVSARVDRLKGLGNAVVPQIPEIIGRAIMAITSGQSNVGE